MFNLFRFVDIIRAKSDRKYNQLKRVREMNEEEPNRDPIERIVVPDELM